MHLPGPLRAAVGLVALAADEAKTLPDRAVEIPMRAVGTALQVSLRAQQRYARLAARGEQVLNRREPGAEAPEWATFDDPLSVEDLHRAALAQLEDIGAGAPDDADSRAASVMIEDILGVSDPAANVSDEAAASESVAESEPAPEPDATVVPISQGAARKSARKSARKAPTKKAPGKKAPAARKTTPSAKKAPVAKKTTPAKKAGKQINKPRHGAPSKFDDAGD